MDSGPECVYCLRWSATRNWLHINTIPSIRSIVSPIQNSSCCGGGGGWCIAWRHHHHAFAVICAIRPKPDPTRPTNINASECAVAHRHAPARNRRKRDVLDGDVHITVYSCTLACRSKIQHESGFSRAPVCVCGVEWNGVEWWHWSSQHSLEFSDFILNSLWAHLRISW